MTYTAVKRFLIGQPFPTHREVHERLDKTRGLAIFASDAISSNAYATEAIMGVLIILGSGALSLTLPIAVAIAALIFLVVFSYIQTIFHYPEGGGSYTVAKDNLGVGPSLVAAAALLVDYVLTVSVSVSAGIRALTSAFPALHEERVLLALLAIALLTLVNLRGVRESGTAFALPTYAFVVGVLVIIVVGLVRYFGLFGAAPLEPHPEFIEPTAALSGFALTWLILRAFAGGCTALTGIEAVSNGVPAFKSPESRNAAQTMVAMGVSAMALFLGISFLATHLSLVPEETDSILSQMTRTVTEGLPGSQVMYFWVQLTTMLILILAANTGYQDFPRLSSYLARDGFLPRWLQHRGDRLAFSYGILVLGAFASIIVIIFRADEIAMLPLYALGVMLCFTLSQAGMVRLMRRVAQVPPGATVRTLATTIHHEAGWWWKMGINALGALTTAIVFVVLIATKFRDGAWIIVIAIPALIVLFRAIGNHYQEVRGRLRTRDVTSRDIANVANVAIVPIADVHRGTLRALKYAKRIAQDVRAVTIITDPDPTVRANIQERWDRFLDLTGDEKLIFIETDYRDVLEPLVQYISEVSQREFPGQLVTVIIPEFVPGSLGEHLLHNQTANLIRVRLRAQPDVVVIDVPYHI